MYVVFKHAALPCGGAQFGAAAAHEREQAQRREGDLRGRTAVTVDCYQEGHMYMIVAAVRGGAATAPRSAHGNATEP